MAVVNDSVGRIPSVGPDDTRAWVENQRGGKQTLLPSINLRVATDTNYIRDDEIPLYGGSRVAHTKAVMNLALPGMRIPNILNWSVNESLEQLTSTANFEAINCHLVSRRSSTLTTALPNRPHNPTIRASYVANSLFVTDRVPNSLTASGDINVAYVKDQYGYLYREDNVRYRQFIFEIFAVSDASKFPDPAIPDDDDNDIPGDQEYAKSATGVGSYFILIDQEVIRVVQKNSNVFSIPPGGRGINGLIQHHNVGAKVSLLNFGPFTGDRVGFGYLNIDDFSPQKAILRPGTALVSYEGYGNISGLLSHKFDKYRNYQFTGYWFVSGMEPSLGEDGIPRIRVDLKGPGHMYEGQVISPDMLQRMKSQFGQWRVGQQRYGTQGRTIWGASGHDRNIRGDWVDFDSWDPSLKNSYPLKIQTAFAQHKAFFDHMNDTQLGRTCLQCRSELTEFYKTHQKGPKTELEAARAVGKHIYKESIRVLEEDAGPIKTYIRLMATIAAAAWDHPAHNTELAQRFSKIPNSLYDNIRNIFTGLIFDGQFAPFLSEEVPGFEWSRPTYDDAGIIMRRIELTCPFESTYDKASFAQPMMDLAETNDCTFWINREGYPVFVPRLWPLRPVGWGVAGAYIGWRKLDKSVTYAIEPYEWYMSYGGSINSYSHSLDASSAVTQCWVTAKDAFDGEFTIASGGTGVVQGKRVNYSPLAGNREGLALTSGVQQVDTISMDNVVLGLDWNTKPGSWGIRENRQGDGMFVPKRPALYDGGVTKQQGDKDATGSTFGPIRRIQMTLNFFLERRLIGPLQIGGSFMPGFVTEDGVFGKWTGAGVKALKAYLNARLTAAEKPGGNLTASSDNYTRQTYNYLKTYFTKFEEYLQTDVWWYVHNGRTWNEYVAAITGIPVPLKAAKVKVKPGSKQALTTPKWVIDDKGMQKEVAKWQKGFAKAAINAGNRRVDDSINKATARTIACNLADPRVQPGDVIWCEVPGFLGASKGTLTGAAQPPFTNGIYVTTISRQLDITQGSYTATYGGSRYRGEVGRGLTINVSNGYGFFRGDL